MIRWLQVWRDRRIALERIRALAEDAIRRGGYA